MDELVAWLTACLDRMEAAARATAAGSSAPETWIDSNPDVEVDSLSGSRAAAVSHGDVSGCGCEDGLLDYGGCRDEHVSAHIALHDPRAVLARVEAERQVVAWAVAERANAGNDWDLCRAADQWELAVRWLAHGHQFDALGYREQWHPLYVAAE